MLLGGVWRCQPGAPSLGGPNRTRAVGGCPAPGTEEAGRPVPFWGCPVRLPEKPVCGARSDAGGPLTAEPLGCPAEESRALISTPYESVVCAAARTSTCTVPNLPCALIRLSGDCSWAVTAEGSRSSSADTAASMERARRPGRDGGEALTSELMKALKTEWLRIALCCRGISSCLPTTANDFPGAVDES